MFKNTSANQQSRTVRTVTESRANEHVDPSAFKAPGEPLVGLSRASQRAALNAAPDRQAVVLLKVRLQARIADMTATISKERSKLPRSQRDNPKAWLGPYYAELDRLKAQLRNTDLALAETKQARGVSSCTLARHEDRERRAADRESFHAAFFQMAKEMLAGPVFDRVLAAAQHRTSAEKGDH